MNMMPNQLIQQKNATTQINLLLDTIVQEAVTSVNLLKDHPILVGYAPLRSESQTEPIAIHGSCDVIPLTPSGEIVPVVACDMSTVKVAETVQGPLWAVRGSIVIRKNNKIEAILAGPFIFTDVSDHVERILQILYRTFGVHRKPVFPASEGPKLVGNIFEKILQLAAAQLLDGGILLVDGSLTAGPVDSPIESVSKIVEAAKKNGMGVAAFSKSTTITYQGKNILSYSTSLNPPYVIRLPYHDRQRWSICEGTVYISHISPVYFPFRVDVSAKKSDVELLNALISSDALFYGYPESLIIAHQLAKISRLDTVSMMATLESSFGLKFINLSGPRSSLFRPVTGS